MSSGTFIPLRNGKPVGLEEIPLLGLEAFQRALASATSRRLRVSSLFGAPAGVEGRLRLYAVLSSDSSGVLHVASTDIEGSTYPSLTPRCPAIHLFEREIAEQWGVVPEGHPWLKPVRFSPPRRSPARSSDMPARPRIGVTDFYRVEGAEVHEVAVGPVHAGVIEPGHFRFQCHGEHVFHLEISLGYQHRGIERALVGGPNKRTLNYLETAAGDTTVGHTLAYCQMAEGLSGRAAPGRAHAIRGIALELERLANHVGDLGALAGDVGYLPTASFCGRLRGDILNTTAMLCGNRFGRGLVRPGGVDYDIDGRLVAPMLSKLADVERDVRSAIGLLWETPSVMSRFEGTGTLLPEDAECLGLVGVAARACGLERDVRHDFPSGIYRLTQIPLSLAASGDVFARAFVRWLEIQRSFLFVRERLAELPTSATQVQAGSLAPNRLCVSLVEGWRGEICHVGLTDDRGQFSTYKIVDPSFHNWSGLSMALREQQISDFPLCNKSFNLSYCGHDL